MESPTTLRARERPPRSPAGHNPTLHARAWMAAEEQDGPPRPRSVRTTEIYLHTGMERKRAAMESLSPARLRVCAQDARTGPRSTPDSRRSPKRAGTRTSRRVARRRTAVAASTKKWLTQRVNARLLDLHPVEWGPREPAVHFAFARGQAPPRPRREGVLARDDVGVAGVSPSETVVWTPGRPDPEGRAPGRSGSPRSRCFGRPARACLFSESIRPLRSSPFSRSWGRLCGPCHVKASAR